MAENLDSLVGLNKSIEVMPDETMVWDEDDELVHLHLISTSGLLKEINYVTGDFLNQFLSEEEISVVVYSEISHLKPVVVGERLVVGIRISEVNQNMVLFKAIVMRETEKIAEATVKRAVVSKNYLRRKALEQL
uniref:Thioesterase n=1 Tax=Fervidobacterium nodosum TaxID=2424 RepID=A0A7C5U447_9BACT